MSARGAHVQSLQLAVLLHAGYCKASLTGADLLQLDGSRKAGRACSYNADVVFHGLPGLNAVSLC